ncbi:hypothetical protein CRYUN_Cryun22dG0093200 [Craigia yunnanensis]
MMRLHRLVKTRNSNDYKDTAKNSQVFTGRPSYSDIVNEFIAPDLVYKTAKEMNINTRFMNISIGPDGSSPEPKTTFVNGIEIMEMMGESDLVPITNKYYQKSVFIIVGSVLGGLVLVCILGDASTVNNKHIGNHQCFPAPNLNLGLRIPFFEIQLSTNNFDKKLQIGKCGFGNVYRGTVRTGMKVAVKRSEPGSGQGLPEFQTEIMVLSKIRHRHLVLLIKHYVNTGVKGSFGYLDPEYFRTQQPTEKSDVYSVGVVLLEVVCARPAINPTLPRQQVNLSELVMLCKKKGLLEQIVDPSIKVQINSNSLRKFADIAEKCLQEDAAGRPTMGDVAWDLEYVLQLQKTAVVREPHEDSTSNASDMLLLPILQRFPSMSAEFGSDNMSVIREDDSDSVPLASEVFSQLRINDAR